VTCRIEKESGRNRVNWSKSELEGKKKDFEVWQKRVHEKKRKEKKRKEKTRNTE